MCVCGCVCVCVCVCVPACPHTLTPVPRACVLALPCFGVLVAWPDVEVQKVGERREMCARKTVYMVYMNVHV